jgi:hypothetical protein
MVLKRYLLLANVTKERNHKPEGVLCHRIVVPKPGSNDFPKDFQKEE